MALRNRENTGKWKREHKIVLFGEFAVEESVVLS
jgi:hypothetical protein